MKIEKEVRIKNQKLERITQKNYKFETTDINILLMAKALTECLSFIGYYDETTFQQKIQSQVIH